MTKKKLQIQSTTVLENFLEYPHYFMFISLKCAFHLSEETNNFFEKIGLETAEMLMLKILSNYS